MEKFALLARVEAKAGKEVELVFETEDGRKEHL
jgi:hypothetical protein